jgi:hypothetical protein
VTRDTHPLKAALSPTPECLAPERFGETLEAREQAHVDACARCQGELALWREFDESAPIAGEGAAVQWIVAELARRNATPADAAKRMRGWWTARMLRPWATAAATVAIAVGIGYFAWDREPGLRSPTGPAPIYRSGQVRAVSPIGDVLTAPTSLEWVAFDQAIRYDIEVTEVDRTLLLRATSLVPRFELPRSLVLQLVPGKTVLWQVRARNASNEVVGESATQQVRVLVPNNR